MLRGPVTVPLRVVMTVDCVGGVWRQTLDLARALAINDVSCRVLGFGPVPSPEHHAESRLVPAIDLAWADAPLDWMMEDGAARHKVTDALLVHAREWQADILHLNLPSQAAALPGPWKVVVGAHSCVPTWWKAVRGGVLPDSWHWQRRDNAAGFARADIIVVPSRSHATAVERVYGRLPGLCVLHNGTSAQPGTWTKEALILAAGRWWDDAKNAACLDAAAAAINWPVVMAGSLRGPDGTATALRHAKGAGSLSQAAMTTLMQRAAIFAAPSRYEPFGLAVLEAAMCGAALVLADIPTFRELWDGVALFVPPGEPASWTAAINRLADDEPGRAHLAGQGQRRAAGMTVARQAGTLTALYAGLA